jgi:hypothetical protein
VGLLRTIARHAVNAALERMFPLELVQSTSVGARSSENENPASASNTAGLDDRLETTVSAELAKKPTEVQATTKQPDLFARLPEIAAGTFVPGRGEVKAELVDIEKAKPLAEVIRLPSPEQASHVLTALPVVRHWLFAPDKTTLRYREFVHETSYRGKDVVQKICIGDKIAAARGEGYRVFTTQTQRALFGIQHLWQTQGGRLVNINGKRFGSVCCSSWQLEEALFGSHGGRQRQLIRYLVQQLASVPVKIENYVDQDGYLSTLDLTGLIHGRFASSRRSHASQMGFPWVEMVVDPVLVNSFERKEVKPIDLEVLRGFKTDIAAILYPKIDHHLSTHSSVELRLDGLVEKLGLTGKQLVQKSYRLRKFAEPVEELSGKPTSAGGVLSVEIQPTADGEDWKLVARRITR